MKFFSAYFATSIEARKFKDSIPESYEVWVDYVVTKLGVEAFKVTWTK